MGWNDFYRRRDVIDTALRRASRDPETPLSLLDLPDAKQVFDSEEELLVALHHKWTLVLGGHLRTELLGEPDAVEGVIRAWRVAVREHPTLRAVLDANLDRYPALRPLREAELRTLAAASRLADPTEPAAEVTKVGAAFDALLRERPERGHAKARVFACPLLGRLVASA